MALKVLKQQAETPVQGGSKDFPAGTWRFEILTPTNSRTRPTPDFMHNAEATAEANRSLPESKQKSPRVAGDTGEILSLWLGNAQATGADAASQANPGKQIFFQDFVITDGDTNIMELDTDAPGEAGWQIQRDARLLANLAIALGAVTEVSEGDKTYVELAENFVDMLKDGEFDGRSVIGTVEHQKWSNKASGKSGVNVVLTAFTAAD